jgi:hypothetical protein
MITAMHLLQSPLDAHVAKLYAKVRNSCSANIAQSTGLYGHFVTMKYAIALVDSSEKMYPNNGLAVEKVVGKTTPDADGDEHDVVADIALDFGQEVIVMNFAVFSPSASSYSENPTESPLTQDGAAKLLEITESGVELRTYLSTVDVDSERFRSICFVVLL